MDKNQNFTITQAQPEEDSIIAQHFYQLWLDNDVDPDSLARDWLNTTLEFITHARQDLSFQAFVARVQGEIVGSASSQLFAGLYPSVFKPSFRKYGYVWNVFVAPDYRRQGIATNLTKKNLAYLRSLNCTHAILHAAPQGKPMYKNLGFVPKNEMILDLG